MRPFSDTPETLQKKKREKKMSRKRGASDKLDHLSNTEVQVSDGEQGTIQIADASKLAKRK